MKILLAIDSSTASQHVINTAATRPWPSGTVFCVMSVVDMGRWEGLPALIEDAKHEAQSVVKCATETLTQSGHEVFSEVQLGLPKKAIPEYAKQWGADLRDGGLARSERVDAISFWAVLPRPSFVRPPVRLRSYGPVPFSHHPRKG